MSKIIVFFLLLIPFNISCEESQDLNGAWALLETYNAWKSGINEELVANKALIGNTLFWVLTNSITIENNDSSKILSVPGGQWKILSIKRVSNNSYKMNLESMRNVDLFGTVFVTETNDNEIYFTEGEMVEGFEDEINQSFLMFGANIPYKRCDIITK